MPRNLGTSRKGKPGKHDRMSGMGRSLQKASQNKYRPRSDGKSRTGDGGMSMQPGVESIGIATAALAELDGKATKSILEMNDLDDFLIQADMAGRDFVTEREGLVVLDATATAYRGPSSVRWSDLDGDTKTKDFVFKELSVPRRPPWDESTTKAALDAQERESFLQWRRGIAAKEEELVKRGNFSTSVTPFEKNLEVWRQLWRVLERSSCLLQLVDARNPLFYLSDDLKQYAESLGKPMMVLINKSDFLTPKQRAAWRDYLISKGWEAPIFFSAIVEQQKLDAEAQARRRQEQEEELGLTQTIPAEHEDEDDGETENIGADSSNGVETPSHRQDGDFDEVEKQPNNETETGRNDKNDSDGVALLTREELMETMLAFARSNACKPDPRFENRIQFGMVGFPNVGKSSVINVLVGSSKHSHGIVRVGVASQPGKTKHFQTLLLPDSDEMMLCDCPGLVFPSFVSNTADLIAAGVYPIAQMRDHWPVTTLICQRIPREIINAQYSIQLPIPSEQEMLEKGLTQMPPPTADEFLTTFCLARSMLAASSGVPDYQRAARFIIKDYADGKLLFCHPPPNTTDTAGFASETIITALINTKRLKEKLLKQQQKNQQYQEQQRLQIENDDEDLSSNDDEQVDDDIDAALLDLLDEVNLDTNTVTTTAQSKPGKANKKGKTPKQKWGKKDRKNRNKDPYGCHSTPDATFFSQTVAMGVSVTGVKQQGTSGGYTRQTTYPIPTST